MSHRLPKSERKNLKPETFLVPCMLYKWYLTCVLWSISFFKHNFLLILWELYIIHPDPTHFPVPPNPPSPLWCSHKGNFKRNNRIDIKIKGTNKNINLRKQKKQKQTIKKASKQNPLCSSSFPPVLHLYIGLSGRGSWSTCVSCSTLFRPDSCSCKCSLCSMLLVRFKASGLRYTINTGFSSNHW